jgi:hypothetical protein
VEAAGQLNLLSPVHSEVKVNASLQHH